MEITPSEWRSRWASLVAFAAGSLRSLSDWPAFEELTEGEKVKYWQAVKLLEQISSSEHDSRVLKEFLKV